MEVSSLARGVMLALASTPIRSITERPSLLPSSFTRTPIWLTLRFAFPELLVCCPGEVWAYLVPCVYPNGLGLAYSPMILRLRQMITAASAT